MTIKKDMLKGTALGLVLGFSAAIFAQAPVVNISKKHGNLRDAQEAIVQAYQKINKAQAANEDQSGGHAQRAKDLLAQADMELSLAANVSNAEGR